MSRIWKLPIVLPNGVNVTIENQTITVNWPKWALEFTFDSCVSVDNNEWTLSIILLDETQKALWWTTRAVIANLVVWVTDWYKKSLEINWVWYKFDIAWQKLILSVWFSHKVEKDIPSDIQVSPDEKAKNVIHVSGIDKQKVWQFASQIKSIKKPEPYKWKGIKYLGEKIRRKAGKSGKK